MTTARIGSGGDGAVFRALREREVTDQELDAAYPTAHRARSRVHWTPVAVARRAALWLVDGDESARVLDVGAGVGKFCHVGAASTDGTFVGVELREDLVEVATQVARRARLSNSSFIAGDMRDIPWNDFTGIYLFNPFAEPLLLPRNRVDDQLKLLAGYTHYVRTVEAKLYLMPPGTRLVTYHGFGAPMPAGYRRVRREQHPTGRLELFVRLPYLDESIATRPLFEKD